MTTKQDTPEKLAADLMLLIGQYWDIAYVEGRENRTTDSPDGRAQRKLTEIYAAVKALAAEPAQLRSQVAPEKQSLTPRQLEMLEFLYGAGPLDGHWFEPDRKPKFWWRAVLREAFGDAAQQAEPATGSWISASDVAELTRRLDIALNGVEGAAVQASLCDIVSQVEQRAAHPAAQGVGTAEFESWWLRCGLIASAKQAAWQGWQARAALAQAPATKEQP